MVQFNLMEEWIFSLLHALSLPEYGLSTVFVVCFIAATLVPLTPTPALLGLIKLNPELFWPAILVATLGNTLGSVVGWWMGYGAKNFYQKIKKEDSYSKGMMLLKRFGPKACLLSWFPVIGDPLCIIAGWLHMPFWRCVAYIAIGKFARFLIMAALLIWVWPGAITFE
ncbi:Inner membrane protein YqaA [Saezia sanguinis]|uniref:Inner membrane protein YqaA n=2 Tax=Saezia sanguinis TaxID=1965230 RepID=A0A433SG50_9BURK|nr:Inner membrane protein YqaA [Saezia sanguinis]